MPTLSEIQKFLSLNIDVKPDIEISEVVSISDHESFTDHTLSWVSSKNVGILSKIKNGVIIAPEGEYETNPGTVFFKVSNPRLTFLKVLSEFFNAEPDYSIAQTAVINNSVSLPRICSIGENVVIEANCYLGEKVVIGHNTVIKSGTYISQNAVIGSNCTIGGVGFGYEKNENGDYIQIPHIGNVWIGQHVEIGNNVCIDRAVLGSTRLSQNVKVDNLVHIAHGVQIDENSLVIANSMIAGSVHIGRDVWVSPSSNILNKISIGDNALIGMGSVVLKDVEKDSIVAGIPAKLIRKKS